jgi:hypothetical protein
MAVVKPFIYRHWQDWADLMVGLLILLSPWLMGFVEARAPTINAIVVGGLIIALSALAIRRLEAWEEWLQIALGVWLILSPWLLDYGAAHGARSSHVALGLLITLLAASELWEEGQSESERGEAETPKQ